MSKEIHINEIGVVKITKKRGLRRMTLSVRPFRPINITIPYSMSYNSAIAFVNEKKDWILKNKKKISETENKRSIFTPESQFKTKERVLVFLQSNRTQIKITKGQIRVEYTDEDDLMKADVQDYIRKGITEALRIEAKTHLSERTEELAKLNDFTYDKLTVRNAKTRWGSCSGINSISLNIHLMRLPEHLIDYVILHELCHTIQKNHGKHFWALLHKVSGNAKGLDKELKLYSPSIW